MASVIGWMLTTRQAWAYAIRRSFQEADKDLAKWLRLFCGVAAYRGATHVILVTLAAQSLCPGATFLGFYIQNCSLRLLRTFESS